MSTISHWKNPVLSALINNTASISQHQTLPGILFATQTLLGRHRPARLTSPKTTRSRFSLQATHTPYNRTTGQQQLPDSLHTSLVLLVCCELQQHTGSSAGYVTQGSISAPVSASGSSSVRRTQPRAAARDCCSAFRVYQVGGSQ